jgi:hypothetical protein
MDCCWGAEGNGREYLERWPRDRVILGSLHPYRLPPSPTLWLRSLVKQVGTPDLTSGQTLLISNHRPGAFGPVAFQRSNVTHSRCPGITPLSDNTVTYSRTCLGNQTKRRPFKRKLNLDCIIVSEMPALFRPRKSHGHPSGHHPTRPAPYHRPEASCPPSCPIHSVTCRSSPRMDLDPSDSPSPYVPVRHL